MTTAKNVLGIFMKQPIPGRVKTRLAASIGDERAAEVYAAFQADIVTNMADVLDRCVLAYAPDTVEARDYFSALGSSSSGKAALDTWPQPEGGLGDRIQSFFTTAFENGAQRVVLIGSDSPNLPQQFVHRAITGLNKKDCVIGPATDGGYYLIGLRAEVASRSASLFVNIDWSTRHVLAQTITRIRDASFSLATLDPWYDVDTLDDLEYLRAHLEALTLGTGTNGSRTADVLRQIPTTAAPKVV